MSLDTDVHMHTRMQTLEQRESMICDKCLIDGKHFILLQHNEKPEWSLAGKAVEMNLENSPAATW